MRCVFYREKTLVLRATFFERWWMNSDVGLLLLQERWPHCHVLVANGHATLGKKSSGRCNSVTHRWMYVLEHNAKNICRTVLSGKEQNLNKQMAEFKISILFQHLVYILAKFNAFSRS